MTMVPPKKTGFYEITIQLKSEFNAAIRFEMFRAMLPDLARALDDNGVHLIRYEDKLRAQLTGLNINHPRVVKTNAILARPELKDVFAQSYSIVGNDGRLRLSGLQAIALLQALEKPEISQMLAAREYLAYDKVA